MLISKSDINEIEINLQYFKTEFEQEVFYLKTHIELCDEITKKQNDLIVQELEEKIEQEPDRESEIHSLFEEKIRTLTCQFFHSNIILIYSSLENSLSSICSNIERQTESPLLLHNIRERNDMLKFKSFFNITSELGSLIEDFPQFDNYRILRNAIAHNSSIIAKNRDFNSVKNEFEEQIEFDDSKNKFYIESKEMPLSFLVKVESFIMLICSNIESKRYVSFRQVSNEEVITTP